MCTHIKWYSHSVVQSTLSNSYLLHRDKSSLMHACSVSWNARVPGIIKVLPPCSVTNFLIQK